MIISLEQIHDTIFIAIFKKLQKLRQKLRMGKVRSAFTKSRLTLNIAVACIVCTVVGRLTRRMCVPMTSGAFCIRVAKCGATPAVSAYCSLSARHLFTVLGKPKCFHASKTSSFPLVTSTTFPLLISQRSTEDDGRVSGRW